MIPMAEVDELRRELFTAFSALLIDYYCPEGYYHRHALQDSAGGTSR